MQRVCVWALGGLLIALTGCAPSRQAEAASDPDLEKEIDQIKAIDNHGHPVRVTAAGEQPDRGFDALPVDHMEAYSEPVNLRPGAPAAQDAGRALYGAAERQAKQRVAKEKGDQYPAWVLDR